jgi:hypothetical protein
MSAACAKCFGGARKSPPVAPANATKQLSSAGAKTPGLPSKGGGSPAPDNPLCRRVRILSPAQCHPYVCARGPDAHLAGVVDARPSLGDQCHLAGGQAVLPLSGRRPEFRGCHCLSGAPAARGPRPPGDHLGWLADPPQPHHPRVPCERGSAAAALGAPASVCPRTES